MNPTRPQPDALADLVARLAGDLPPIARVKTLHAIELSARAALPEAVAQARQSSVTWIDLGQALGVSRQAVRAKYADADLLATVAAEAAASESARAEQDAAFMRRIAAAVTLAEAREEARQQEQGKVLAVQNPDGSYRFTELTPDGVIAATLAHGRSA